MGHPAHELSPICGGMAALASGPEGGVMNILIPMATDTAGVELRRATLGALVAGGAGHLLLLMGTVQHEASLFVVIEIP